jgi:NAD(P)-dependent dehydrogenase (short-subunit alcohol dehydrogenase family)
MSRGERERRIGIRRVVVTGISGTLGQALGALYRARGDEVVGVTHREGVDVLHCDRLQYSAQQTIDDARALFDCDPDIVILNAGRIETEVGDGGLPLAEATQEIYRLNAVFPSLVALAAAKPLRSRRLDVVAIGSIADGSPSCFGPVYHASKAALHQFVAGTGPIVHAARPHVRIRLYRPGVIRGPLSWAPVLRLNERGRSVRARRCEGAPAAEVVARRIADWIDGDAWIGSDPEPLSFRILKLLHGLAPNAYARLQHLAWRRGSCFEPTASPESATSPPRRDPGPDVPTRAELRRASGHGG